MTYGYGSSADSLQHEQVATQVMHLNLYSVYSLCGPDLLPKQAPSPGYEQVLGPP